jgi:hypothetical protein
VRASACTQRGGAFGQDETERFLARDAMRQRSGATPRFLAFLFAFARKTLELRG